MGIKYVTGLQPAKHVGANIFKTIERLILDNEGRPDDELHASFEEEVKRIRKRKSLRKPQGKTSPKKNN